MSAVKEGEEGDADAARDATSATAGSACLMDTPSRSLATVKNVPSERLVNAPSMRSTTGQADTGIHNVRISPSPKAERKRGGATPTISTLTPFTLTVFPSAESASPNWTIAN